MRSGPIIVVEDDIDDKEIFDAALQELQSANKIIWKKFISKKRNSS